MATFSTSNYTIVMIDGCHILLMTSHLIEETLDKDAYQLALLRRFKLKARMFIQIKDIFAPLMTISINSVLHLFGKSSDFRSHFQYVWNR